MSIEMGLSKLPHSVGVLCILRREFLLGVFLRISSRLLAPLKTVQTIVLLTQVAIFVA